MKYFSILPPQRAILFDDSATYYWYNSFLFHYVCSQELVHIYKVRITPIIVTNNGKIHTALVVLWFVLKLIMFRRDVYEIVIWLKERSWKTTTERKQYIFWSIVTFLISLYFFFSLFFWLCKWEIATCFCLSESDDFRNNSDFYLPTWLSDWSRTKNQNVGVYQLVVSSKYTTGMVVLCTRFYTNNGGLKLKFIWW